LKSSKSLLPASLIFFSKAARRFLFNFANDDLESEEDEEAEEAEEEDDDELEEEEEELEEELEELEAENEDGNEDDVGRFDSGMLLD
jgi:hypothetical protein